MGIKRESEFLWRRRLAGDFCLPRTSQERRRDAGATKTLLIWQCDTMILDFSQTFVLDRDFPRNAILLNGAAKTANREIGAPGFQRIAMCLDTVLARV
jgi:hypothetical protein